LVIGSKKHSLANKCVLWGEDFYTGNYDVVIVNAKTLTKEKIKQILKENSNYFSKIRNELAEAQLQNNITLACIMSEFKFYHGGITPA